MNCGAGQAPFQHIILRPCTRVAVLSETVSLTNLPDLMSAFYLIWDLDLPMDTERLFASDADAAGIVFW